MRIPRVLGGVPVAAVAVVVLLVAGPGVGTAEASCVGPALTLSSPTTPPGTRVTLVGAWFGTDCNDTGGSGPVLGSPQQDLEIVVRVGAAEKVIGTVDVGADYDFVLPIHIPPSLGTGSGAVEARAAGRLVASVPLEVAGPPGDLGDQPYFEYHAPMSGRGVSWGWVLLGVGIGIAVGAVGALSAARRP